MRHFLAGAGGEVQDAGHNRRLDTPATRAGVELDEAEQVAEIVNAVELAFSDVCQRIQRDPLVTAGELDSLVAWRDGAMATLDKLIDEADAARDLATFAFLAQSGADRLNGAATEFRSRCEFTAAVLWNQMNEART